MVRYSYMIIDQLETLGGEKEIREFFDFVAASGYQGLELNLREPAGVDLALQGEHLVGRRGTIPHGSDAGPEGDAGVAGGAIPALLFRRFQEAAPRITTRVEKEMDVAVDETGAQEEAGGVYGIGGGRRLGARADDGVNSVTVDEHVVRR